MKISRLPRVSVDESGNTGEDLLSPRQPTFVLASTSLTDTEAVHLIESIGGSPDVELKYGKLRKSGKGRALIARLLAALEPDAAKTEVINKRFMIVAKMVDNLIEPLASKTGFNLYGRGAHTALTEVWYQVFPAMLGEDRTRVLLERFVTMCRNPTPTSIGSFYSLVDNTRTGEPEVDSDLELIGVTREAVTRSMLSTALSDGLDPAIPALFATAGVWGRS